VARCAAASSSSSAPPDGASAAAAGEEGVAGRFVDGQFLGERIAALEQKWGGQVKELKEDLRRTILAHNHNSDLMRDHKNRLEDARRRIEALTNPRAAQVDAQVEKLDRMLRSSQAKQKALDDLTKRLTSLEKQAASVAAASVANASVGSAASAAALSAMMAGAMPGLFPPMPHGMPDDWSASAAAAFAAAAGAKKAAAGAAAAGAAGTSPTKGFNAEAPVFVPRGGGGGGGAAASALHGEGIKEDIECIDEDYEEDDEEAEEACAADPFAAEGATVDARLVD